jgi:hypothetical protein
LRWTEADIAYDLASRLEGRLAAAGMRVHLTRGPSPSARLSEFDRASLANELGADLLISIHLDGHANPAASGVATYHFGQYGEAGVTSTLGERLAALVQREIVARTGLRDCRTHAKTWDLLRLTRMPTVRVEAGYLTSREDRDRLVDPLFRDRLVAAIVASVKRMYLPIESDVSTGSIDVDTLRPTTALVTTATGAIERSSGAPNGRAERAERTARADRPAQASRPERGERPERPVADSGAEAPSDRSIAGTDRSTGETDRSVDRAVHAAGRWRVIDAEQADRPA